MLSGDEDAVAPPPRLPRAEKERLRGMELTFTLRMYDYAVAYLQRTLQRTKRIGFLYNVPAPVHQYNDRKVSPPPPPSRAFSVVLSVGCVPRPACAERVRVFERRVYYSK